MALKNEDWIKEIRGAVARGWCADANQNKEMDVALAEAISQEVLLLISTPPQVVELPTPFQVELRRLINVHSKENDSDTPDFILAIYLDQCLTAFERATKARDRWHGTKGKLTGERR